jgi:hypothetical protein
MKQQTQRFFLYNGFSGQGSTGFIEEWFRVCYEGSRRMSINREIQWWSENLEHRASA